MNLNNIVTPAKAGVHGPLDSRVRGNDVLTMKTLVVLSLFIFTSSLSAKNGIVFSLGGFYGNTFSSPLTATFQSDPQLTNATLAPISLNSFYGGPKISIGYLFQNRTIDWTPRLSFEYGQYQFSQANILENYPVATQNEFVLDASENNLLLELDIAPHTKKRWQPFLRLGIGASAFAGNSTLTINAPGFSTKNGESINEVRAIEEIGVGINWQLDSVWSLSNSLNYRYAGDIDLGNFYENEPITSGVDLSLPAQGYIMWTVTFNYTPPNDTPRPLQKALRQ